MSVTATAAEQETLPTKRIDIDLSSWQYEALVRCDHFKITNLIGGRGSGKSFLEPPRVARWMQLTTELYYGIFGASDTVLQTIMAPIKDLMDDMGLQWRYEQRVPGEWVSGWIRDGVPFPPQRLRGTKLFVVENGLHILTGSLMNNAYTRFKSVQYNQIYIGESTEPGVTRNAILTLLGACRCGSATKGPDGIWRCREPGHLHNIVMAGNVPLNDPGNYVYRFDDQMQKQERKREAAKKPPFYRLLVSATPDNPYTGADYDDMMQAAMDHETYMQQTGRRGLSRNTAATSYYSFSERNILGTLTYDPTRPLYIWFDFNTTPATAGWGHDLRYDEVPSVELREGLDYFGIVGELFSGPEPMQTDQVAYALLEDPTEKLPFAEARCADCNCWLRDHLELDAANGWLCRRCAWMQGDRYCTGRPVSIEERSSPGVRQFINAPSNWRGLARHRAAIYVYGDATGKATHADALKRGGSRGILRDIFTEHLGDRVHFRIPESNPSIKLRVLSMNRMFQAANGIRRLYVAPWCEAHITDFREVVPHPKTGEPLKVAKTPNAKNDYWLRTDSSDGAGYHVVARCPAIIPKSSMPARGEDVDLGPMETWWERP